MENILTKLESKPNFKEHMKEWCKNNGIKVSFLITMTLSKAKSIYKKLTLTYSKGYGKTKTRWLENQLRLFHFILLAVSCLDETKISDFNQNQWRTLNEAFPNKSQSVLEYEGIFFVAPKSCLKRKWQQSEDKLLLQIIEGDKEEPRWNQIATQLFIKSERKFFRNGKQCRQRWLNHLDDGIKHEKWSAQQDKILIKNVMESGKKWSYIMKCFGNKRTEHMIKNRFLSLILRCRKNNPSIIDEEKALYKIAAEFDLYPSQNVSQFEQGRTTRRLRERQQKSQSLQKVEDQFENHQHMDEDLQEQRDQIRLLEDQPMPQLPFFSHFPDISGIIQAENSQKNDSFKPQQGVFDNFNENFGKLSPTINNLPTPSAFMSPLSPFMNCNNFLNSINYFQWCVNNFAAQNHFSGNQ